MPIGPVREDQLAAMGFPYGVFCIAQGSMVATPCRVFIPGALRGFGYSGLPLAASCEGLGPPGAAPPLNSLAGKPVGSSEPSRRALLPSWVLSSSTSGLDVLWSSCFGACDGECLWIRPAPIGWLCGVTRKSALLRSKDAEVCLECDCGAPDRDPITSGEGLTALLGVEGADGCSIAFIPRGMLLIPFIPGGYGTPLGLLKLL